MGRFARAGFSRFTLCANGRATRVRARLRSGAGEEIDGSSPFDMRSRGGSRTEKREEKPRPCSPQYREWALRHMRQ